MRKLFVLLHRYAGLVLGLFLFVTGLTGSAIVFSKAIDTALNPALMFIQPSADSRLHLEEGLQNARREVPQQRAAFIYMPLNADEPAQVVFQPGGARVHANPYTGEVLGVRHPNESLTGFLIDLHVHLLAGKTGQKIQGWIGLAAILLTVVGFVLWWPKTGRWNQALSIKWRAGAFRVWFDCHRVVGATAGILIVITALTGSALALYDMVTEPVLVALTGKGTREPPPASPPGSAPKASLDSLIAEARKMYPDATVTRITLPAKENGAVGVRMRLNGEVHQFGRSFVWFSQSGGVLRVDNALEAHLAVKIQSWLFPLHTGFYGGAATQWLQLFTGLGLSFLSASGIWLWLKRTRARAAARLPSATRVA
ncbi:PepSY-associated TM helix domain-containing protein [Noviherbaspirillum aerium]|uniref:PepSY-associated TM helix domain-containing protein n=1 Tax=Noviherbaspirillum aerium TaxID=2588497 RepID=UPI00124EBF7C|nr:PepSY-associated TM helix domain-containing protein [Noviherbaspirillum aerium]